MSSTFISIVRTFDVIPTVPNRSIRFSTFVRMIQPLSSKQRTDNKHNIQRRKRRHLKRENDADNPQIIIQSNAIPHAECSGQPRNPERCEGEKERTELLILWSRTTPTHFYTPAILVSCPNIVVSSSFLGQNEQQTLFPIALWLMWTDTIEFALCSLAHRVGCYVQASIITIRGRYDVSMTMTMVLMMAHCSAE